MRVLQVSYGSLAKGGMQAVLMSICRNLSNDSTKFDVLVFNEKEEYYEEEFKNLGGRIFRIPIKLKKNKFFNRIYGYTKGGEIIYGTYKILKRNGPYDAIHCHNLFESGLCCLAAFLAGVPVRIAHSHSNENSSFKESRIYILYNKMMKNFIKKFATVKIGCSIPALKNLFGDDPSAFVVNNAIDLEKFNPNNYPEKQLTDQVKIIHIGRFSKQKNQEFLLMLFQKILTNGLNAHLTIVGRGNDEKLLKNLVKELNIERFVEFLPSDSDIPFLLSRSNLMILPSISEGLPVVLVEAQAMNVHCIASTASPIQANLGICEFLDLKLGIDNWAQYIEDYLKRTDLSMKAKQEEVQKYNIKTVVKQYEAIYNQENY